MKQTKQSQSDFKNKVIQRQTNQIKSLEQKIEDLQINCDGKDELINSIEPLRAELKDAIADIKLKGEEYDRLIDDLKQMKKAMSQEVFKGEFRWKIIKWLMK